jgi:hypothetical protein
MSSKNSNINLITKVLGASSSSSNLPSTNKLNDLKHELLTTLNINKNKIQNRASLSLQKQISTALRPVKLKNIQNEYISNLEKYDENKPKLSLSALKALKFEKHYIVDVIFYSRNNPNQLDEITKLPLNKIKPAFYDKINENERGTPYWMTHIHDGVRQYTIDIPADFNILEIIKRKIFKHKLLINHGRTFRATSLNGAFGLNPLYETMINYFETDNEFLQWYGYIAEYLHAFQILSVKELSNEDQPYNPLDADLMDVSKLSIANKYIETTLDLTKDSFFEAMKLGYAKHHN